MSVTYCYSSRYLVQSNY